MLKGFVMLGVLIAVLSAGVSCMACLWDRDTLAMERQRFPTTLELITGKFLRHSPAFYRWRISDCQERIETEPTPELFDDLAVAYDKTGATEEAVRVMEAKSALYPGLYSTHANLGTFHIHAGSFDLGLEEIEKALVINPNAHFGREIHQKRLVEYLQTRRGKGDALLPLSEEVSNGNNVMGFGAFLMSLQSGEGNVPDRADLIDEAIVGVLGMMKFGNHDSPVLLEVLGDLLVSRGFDSDAKQLAARAYLAASYESAGRSVQQAYRSKAEECLKFQTRSSGSKDKLMLAQLEMQFQDELKEASDWYAVIVTKEKDWIAEGVDVEKSFEVEFYEAPVVGPVIAAGGGLSLGISLPTVAAAVFVFLCGIPALLWQGRRRARAAAEE